MQEFISYCFNGSPELGVLNDYYKDFFEKLFIQTNPLPVKTLLAEK